MDGLLHSYRKILVERAANSQEQSDIPDTAPPAYSADPFEDMDDLEDDELPEDPSPVTLTLNTGTNVQGTGNMVASPPLADATRFSTLLLAAVQSLNAVKANATDSGSKAPLLKVNLVINCGVTVNGDRNVIGYKTQAVLPNPMKRKAVEEICLSSINT